MGAAAVISLAEVREKKQRAEFRQQLHARFDHWIDALEAQMKEPKPALEQITRVVWEARQELTGSLTATAVKVIRAYAQLAAFAACQRWV